MPDPFPAASGMPESGSGNPNIPSQNGDRPDVNSAPERRPAGHGPTADDANIYGSEASTANGRSDTAPENFLDFLDRLSERVFAKNKEAWPAVLQFALLLLLLSASVIVLMGVSVMAAHAAGVPGWAIGAGTAASAGGAAAVKASRRRTVGRSGGNRGQGQQGRGRRPNRGQGSHRRR
ncbi:MULTISPECIES: hypothetical protein [unclassified Streptomyces]|uniref:hypothetical protein n=1 Tax=unclassified Streptomyces TaxID=2593676 RepID=UPI00403C5FD6